MDNYYIRLEDAIRALSEESIAESHKMEDFYRIEDYDAVREILLGLPTTKVVRCENCRHFTASDGDCDYLDQFVEKDFYCKGGDAR